MPSLRAYLTGKACLWQLIRYDEYGEAVLKDTAVELDVRWDFAKQQIIGARGEPIAIDGSFIMEPDIALYGVTERITERTPLIGSVVADGGLDRWGGMTTESALDIAGQDGLAPEVPSLMRVMYYSVRKDLRKTLTLGIARVKFYRDTLPTLEAAS